MSDKKLKRRDDMKVCDLAHKETLTGDACDGEDDAHTNHMQESLCQALYKQGNWMRRSETERA